MRNRKLSSLLTLFTFLVLCSSGSQSQQNSSVFTLTTGNQTYSFIPQPQLGYVIKSSDNKSAMTLVQNSLQGVQSDSQEKYLNVANRPDMMVVLGDKPLAQNQNKMNLLSIQSGTEYIAPVYSLNGQTVAVIPEIIVRLINESDYDNLADLCQKLGCKMVRSLLYTKQEYLISPNARTAEEVLIIADVLDSENFIEWAFPNLAFQPQFYNEPVMDEPNRVEPNDTYFKEGKLWHLENIHAPEAWAYTTGDPNIVIAVLDSGVDINHPDLKNNIWTNPNEIPNNGIDDDNNGFIDDVHGWNFYHNDPNVSPSGNDAHGTACAGLIAAEGNNNLGVSGVAPNCKIMPLRISNGSNFITDVEIGDTMRYAAKNRADILNNSYGKDTGYPAPDVQSAIREVTCHFGKLEKNKFIWKLDKSGGV